ncbi:MAG: tyrosine-type recombinase/integrase [Treponema sp.]|jgi:integrase|nr:tyrosine-type recombinase/integrase [Treponema sp.]
MNIIFNSLFKDELFAFMEYIKLSVKDEKVYFRTLADFDSFLHAEGLAEKKIDANQVMRWLDGLSVCLSTKKCRLQRIKKFTDYLSAIGISASLPELPRNTVEFKPYVFSAHEMNQIFEMADDLILMYPNAGINAEFPILLRILYGCGLRLGEAASLPRDDIDLAAGIIKIKAAKKQRQRIVPMSNELTRILKLYKKAVCFQLKDCNLLFKKNDGQSRVNQTYLEIFNKILYGLGIKNAQNKKCGAHGPCLHSLRHSFAFHSLLKAEAGGRGFMETVPFLSTYLGHAGLMETDKYLKASHELYTKSHSAIANYTRDVFPQEV